MRSKLLYVVPLLFTAGSALAQQYQNPMYITQGNGPVRVMNGRVPPNYVEADGPNALYPVKSYVIERQPIVMPAPQVTVTNNIIMPRPPVVKHHPRVHRPRPPCQCKL